MTPPSTKQRAVRALPHVLPRLIASAVIPSICFAVGRAEFGLPGAVLASAGWSVGYQGYVRSRGRPWSVLSSLSLAELLIRSGISLGLGSTTAFFVVPSIVTAAFGAVYLLSCLAGRPLLALVADEVLPAWLVDSAALRASRTLRRASLIYGIEQILVAALSIALAVYLSPTQYVTVHPPMSWTVFWAGLGLFALTYRPPQPEATAEWITSEPRPACSPSR